MSLHVHNFNSDPIYNLMSEMNSATETYKVDTHIEELVREELLNTLKFIVALYDSQVLTVDERVYKQAMEIFLELHKSYSWKVSFDSEIEFLTFLRTICDLRDTYLNSLLYILIKNGVHPDKAGLALQKMMRAYDISSLDLQHRQLTASRY